MTPERKGFRPTQQVVRVFRTVANSLAHDRQFRSLRPRIAVDVGNRYWLGVDVL